MIDVTIYLHSAYLEEEVVEIQKTAMKWDNTHYLHSA